MKVDDLTKHEPLRLCVAGAASATRAAAAGGATTLVDMPLNSVPTTTTAAILRDKINAVKVCGPYTSAATAFSATLSSCPLYPN